MTDRSGPRHAAVDLGAESGRVLVGTFDGGRLALDEVHRFANTPVRVRGTLHWDVLRLWADVEAGLRRAGAAGALASVAVDTWGVDFGLLDERGRLLANPVHYRDRRTDGVPERVFALVPHDEVYATTGIQVMPINTLYQLAAMALERNPLLGHARRLLLMPDLMT
ncbi:MAG TPA: FGGY family carbohydrate kinase, partial [Candidatus Limnocylindrales bacterium]